MEKNPKREAVGSERLVNALLETTRGAWLAYLELDHPVRTWVSSMAVTMHLMADGITLTELTVELTLVSIGATGDWREKKSFSLPQLSGKKAGFVSQILKVSIQREIMKVALKYRELALARQEQTKQQAARAIEGFQYIADSLQRSIESFPQYPIQKIR